MTGPTTHEKRALSFTLGLLLLVLLSPGARTYAGELVVQLNNPPDEGAVTLVLFDSANRFGDVRNATRIERHEPSEATIYRMDNVPPGNYAMMVYHDENDNQQLDKNFIGIPREPLGFSNNYHPKGPPAYRYAAFTLAADETLQFDMELKRPLGELGQLGVGVGIIGQSSPYRNNDGDTYQVIPALSYTGDRLQILGPQLQVSLFGSGALRLAATGRYHIGAYDESDSPVLEGLGDRRDTFMAGLALEAELMGGIDLSAGYEFDVLDRFGGGIAGVDLGKSFQWNALRLTPSLGLNLASPETANYDFGVPADRATPERPTYRLSSTLNPKVGLGAFMELPNNWILVVSSSLEFLDDEITGSPLVDDSVVLKTFATLTYLFGS